MASIGFGGALRPARRISPRIWVLAMALAALVMILAGYGTRPAAAQSAEGGEVLSWGNCFLLGDNDARCGNANDYATPGLTDVKEIATGSNHGGDTGFSLALKSDGTVFAWGNNNWGQLGDGTTSCQDCNRVTPGQVKGPGGVSFLEDVRASAASAFVSLALRAPPRR